MIEVLFFLVALHFIGDFPLQGVYLAENKGKNDYILFAHSFIWAGVISAGLLYFGIFSMWKTVFLVFFHFCIDRVKARGVSELYLTAQQALLFDQFLHFIQIIVVIII